LVENFCRNPDGSATIWCFTTDPNTRREDCDPIYDKYEVTWTKAATIAAARIDVGASGPYVIKVGPPAAIARGTYEVAGGAPGATSALVTGWSDVGSALFRELGAGANGDIFAIPAETTLLHVGRFPLPTTGLSAFSPETQATKVSVDRFGNPWYVQPDATVAVFDGRSVAPIGGVTATDVDIGRDGSVWLIDTTG
jgi:hypothetical protein